MLTIRFNRIGKKNKAYFRLVVQEHTIAPGGGHVEILGSYNPHLKKESLKPERIKYWVEKGVKISDTAYNFLVSKGIIVGQKRAVKFPKKPARDASHSDAGGAEASVTAEKTVENKIEQKTKISGEEEKKTEVKEEKIKEAVKEETKEAVEPKVEKKPAKKTEVEAKTESESEPKVSIDKKKEEV
jgi:small subunit ribosomal protein S16